MLAQLQTDLYKTQINTALRQNFKYK